MQASEDADFKRGVGGHVQHGKFGVHIHKRHDETRDPAASWGKFSVSFRLMKPCAPRLAFKGLIRLNLVGLAWINLDCEAPPVFRRSGPKSSISPPPFHRLRAHLHPRR